MFSLKSLQAYQSEGERGNVVVLAKRLSGLGDGFGRLRAEGGCALEAEQCTRLVAGFDYAIGDQRQLLARSQLK
jgi:hypothetical protein